MSHIYVAGPGPKGGIGVVNGGVKGGKGGGSGGSGGNGRIRSKLSNSLFTMKSNKLPVEGAVVSGHIGILDSKKSRTANTIPPHNPLEASPIGICCPSISIVNRGTEGKEFEK